MSDNKYAICAKQQAVERLEDMSPDGFLRIFKQDDGDMCLTIGGYNLSGDLNFSSIEFCQPSLGGGSSPKTWEALHDLFIAMMDDQKNEGHRNGRYEIEGDENDS